MGFTRPIELLHVQYKLVDWCLMSQTNCCYEQRHRVGQRIVLLTRAFLLSAELSTHGPYWSLAKDGAHELHVPPKHCWQPRPKIEPATSSSVAQRSTNRAIRTSVCAWCENPRRLFHGSLNRCLVLAPSRHLTAAK